MESTIFTDWQEALATLDTRGFVRIPSALSGKQCREIRALYQEDEMFRSTIDMERYRFGRGEYRYFNYPLPALIQGLRAQFYQLLVPLANVWMDRLGSAGRYPPELEKFLSLCHSRNQKRPTPLVLRYDRGGHNTLHQDIYGEVFFPFQAVFMLSQKGVEYDGGELVFVEQLPRAQSRAEVLTPAQGDAVIFTTNFRPVKGSKGYYRARMKHAVSPVRQGLRYTMGIIFHDAN